MKARTRTAVWEAEVVTLYSSHKFGDKCFITYDASLHFAHGLITFRITVSYSHRFMVQQSPLKMRCLASHDIHVGKKCQSTHHRVYIIFMPHVSQVYKLKMQKMCMRSTEHTYSVLPIMRRAIDLHRTPEDISTI